MIRGHDLWNSINGEAIADGFPGCYNLFELSAPLSRDAMPEDLTTAADIVRSTIFYFRRFAERVQRLSSSDLTLIGL